jgi:transcriptional regulator with XRE-family HTH domain
MTNHGDLIRLLEELIAESGGNAPAARRLGVTPSTLWKWIQQGRQPTVEHCVKIAAAAGLHPLEVIALAYGLELPPFDRALSWDDRLLPEARQHLSSQHKLLLRIRADEQEE